jgi:hypothetical protein
MKTVKRTTIEVEVGIPQEFGDLGDLNKRQVAALKEAFKSALVDTLKVSAAAIMLTTTNQRIPPLKS